jgi:hypothetical protein
MRIDRYNNGGGDNGYDELATELDASYARDQAKRRAYQVIMRGY